MSRERKVVNSIAMPEPGETTAPLQFCFADTNVKNGVTLMHSSGALVCIGVDRLTYVERLTRRSEQRLAEAKRLEGALADDTTMDSEPQKRKKRGRIPRDPAKLAEFVHEHGGKRVSDLAARLRQLHVEDLARVKNINSATFQCLAAVVGTVDLFVYEKLDPDNTWATCHVSKWMRRAVKMLEIRRMFKVIEDSNAVQSTLLLQASEHLTSQHCHRCSHAHADSSKVKRCNREEHKDKRRLQRDISSVIAYIYRLATSEASIKKNYKPPPN